MDSATLPIVLAIGGNDPTGGAGIAADVEAIISQGCHALPVISCLTVQDTCDVNAIEAVNSDTLIQQSRAVMEDLPVNAIKIGLLGSEENVEAVHEIILDYPDIPVVLDPIIYAGGGAELSSGDMIDAMQELLIPYVTVLTPNTLEALEMVPGADNSSAAISALLELGCEWILLTGTHEKSDDVVNKLFSVDGEVESYSWPRLPKTYHGSGCTLAAALAGLIAHDIDIPDAVAQAQDYTWRSLQAGYRLGMGQLHPNRLFWVEQENEPED